MANWKFYLDGNEVEEPIGWDAIEFTAIRMESHGIDQPFSTEVRFYGKGAKYIKSIYDQYFINQPIAITITSDVGYNNSAFQFDGFLNLAIYEEKNVCDTDSWEITVGIIDDNFRERFKSRMDVDIDIYATKDLDENVIPEPEFDETRLHTQEVYLVAYAQNLDKDYPLQPWALLFYNYDDGWKRENFVCVLPAYFSNSDFKGSFGSTFDPQQPKFTTTNTCFFNNSNATRTITVGANVKGAIQWTAVGLPNNTANIWLIFEIWHNGNFISSSSPAASANATYGGPLVEYDLSLSFDATLPPNYYIIAQLRWGNGGNIQADVIPPNEEITRQIGCFVRECCLTVTETNGAEYASFSETLKVKDFLKRLIYIITGDNDGLVSDTFEPDTGCYWNYALTNGLKIRSAKTAAQAAEVCDPLAQFEKTNFIVSFKKLFESLSSIFCLGWAFEFIGGQWKVRIETIDYFYQNQISFNANNVGEVTQLAMGDKLANQISIGYDDTWKNIQVAGLWAIHTDRNYFIKNRAMVENSTSKIEKLSGIIAEGYAIEFSRRLYFFQDDSGSSDRPNDYEMFIIWLNRNELVIEDIEDSEYSLPPKFEEEGTVTLAPGTVSMSSDRIQQSNSEVGALYNINITPARNAMRWWKVLGMHTYGVVNPKMQYQTGQYQTQYSSIIAESTEPCQESISGSVVYENGDINPTLLKPEYQNYLFRPIEVTFSYPQSLCDFLTLSQDEQYKKVRLTSGSLVIEGFITSATNQPEDASGGTTQFTLLYSNLQSEPGGAFDEGFDDGYDNGG